MPDARRRQKEIEDLIMGKGPGMNICPICHGEDGLLCRRCRAEAAMRLDLRSADIAVHEAAVALELADTERAALRAAVKAHLASHHHGGYNQHTALTALMAQGDGR